MGKRKWKRGKRKVEGEIKQGEGEGKRERGKKVPGNPTEKKKRTLEKGKGKGDWGKRTEKED